MSGAAVETDHGREQFGAGRGRLVARGLFLLRFRSIADPADYRNNELI